MTVIEETPDTEVVELPDFMIGHEIWQCEQIDSASYVEDAEHVKVDSLDEANLISSKRAGSTKHKVILDIDFPAELIPSSTPGHFHLYLDKELTTEQMERLVFTLYEVGIIAEGNRNQWLKFKALFLRLPWVKKSEDATDDTPKDVAAMQAAGRQVAKNLVSDGFPIMAPF